MSISTLSFNFFDLNPMTWLKLGLGIGAVIAATIFVTLFIPWLLDLRRELRYINMEIERNHGKERERWKKRKKRLLLSILPFFPF